MINNSADAFFCPRSLSINMLQNKHVTHYFWNTGSHIFFIQKCVYNTTAGSRLGLFSLAERNIIDQWKYSVEIRSAVVMSTKVCKLKMAVMISGSYFVKYCFWSILLIVLLRNHGQKNASAQLFIMILPSSIYLLQRIDNTIFKREGKHHFLKKYT